MNTATYVSLPNDIRREIHGSHTIDEGLPDGVVQVIDTNGTQRLSTRAFVKQMRAARKRRRQAIKRGRR